MNEIFSLVIGPLAGPECRRAVGRGWILLVRTLAGLAFATVVLTCVWWWWLNQTRITEAFMPYETMRVGLVTLMGLAMVGALVLTPALLAGSLAGDRDRQAMSLLLTTGVSSFEIVRGRIAGKYSQIFMILLAGTPLLLFLGTMAGVGPLVGLTMLLFPMAIAFGAAGLTAGLSSVSKRGRDALLGTYLIGLVVLSAPGLFQLIPAVPLAITDALAVLNPFTAIGPLVWGESLESPLRTMAVWMVMGVAGTGIATWRLRPNCLRWLGGEIPKRGATRRWRRVPPMGEHPMLWKELYIERGGSLSGVARWLGSLGALYLIGASLGLGVAAYYMLAVKQDEAKADEMVAMLQATVVDTAWLFSILIQLAVGLRAAVAIANERERMTWDGLLTSPLEGREIVWSKLWGSLFSLRWLLIATFFAWSIALGVQAMPPGQYLRLILGTVIVAAFLGAVGVRTSLTVATGTLSMAVTIGVWLGAWLLFSILGGILVGIGALVFLVAWMAATQMGLTTAPNPWFPIDGGLGFFLSQNGLFLVSTILIAMETSLRFDRLAGRIAGGTLAVSIDEVLHGRPMSPEEFDREYFEEPPDPAAVGKAEV